MNDEVLETLDLLAEKLEQEKAGISQEIQQSAFNFEIVKQLAEKGRFIDQFITQVLAT